MAADDGAGDVFLHVRALVDEGALLRAAGLRREAREPLRRALDLAQSCPGAMATARRAREEFGFLRQWSIYPAQIEPITRAMACTSRACVKYSSPAHSAWIGMPRRACTPSEAACPTPST